MGALPVNDIASVMNGKADLIEISFCQSERNLP